MTGMEPFVNTYRYAPECKPEDAESFAERAEDLRDLASRWKNPHYPHIPCFSECGKQAEELYYFCSVECRDRYYANKPSG